MHATPDFAGVAALAGVPSRAAMLVALADGKALPASELAFRARLSPQTASTHLAKLVDGGLLSVERCGRHRYYRMASPEISAIMETLMALAPPLSLRPGLHRPELEALRAGRTCYRHLAGKLGVELARALERRGFVRLDGADYRVTPSGYRGFAKLGIDIDSLARQRRLLARRCIDWSERLPHIGGALGEAIAERFFEQQWIRRGRRHRSVRVTEPGRRALRRELGLDW